MPTIYTLGELLVEIMRPTAGVPLDLLGEFCGPFPSGAPGIFISTAARLGYRTAIIAGVGRDKFGRNILERLRRDGVDCSQVQHSQRPTAVAFVSYDKRGEREFLYHIGGTAADDLDFRPQALPRPEHTPFALHVMGCSLMASEPLRQGILQAVQHYQGGEISFDPNLRPELLRGRSFDQLAGDVLRCCTILLPGEAELLLAAGVSTANLPSSPAPKQLSAAAEALFAGYPRLRLINLKRGERGSTIYTREGLKAGQPITVPPYPIADKLPVIDPTGAGDCFDAAFVGAVLDGLPLERAGFLAAKAGAINLTALGPMEGDMTLLRQHLLPVDPPWL